MSEVENINVEVTKTDDATVVVISGVLDALALPSVSRELADAQGSSDPVYVDLSGVTFMDSRGLGSLLAARERSRDGAAPVYIHRPSEAVRRILDVSGVRSVLDEVDELPV
ncbi:MAG: STAS domain-containing protein [Miltoncostaeaceae bacterium]